MSAAAVLPFVWAVANLRPDRRPAAEPEENPLAPQMAFYRKYTEAMLQRYVRMSMEAGKAPSLLGQEMFRGRVTSYRVRSFEDVVIFLHDVEKSLEKLDLEQQDLIWRIGLQVLLGLPPRTVVRRYGMAIDRLTRIFLSVQMLEPLQSCQGGKAA
jgi:hypothetical protein